MESLAVKYRPRTFEDVCGQVYTVGILKKQIADNKIKNGYLFCGASGCGKTTIARIFANQINEGKGSPIELDAASNNGVEDMRLIIKEAALKSLNSKYKVYIIDEAHAISNAGWQALLKTLEEPPTLTIFIFATTEPQKIPITIQNRLQRFDFNRMPIEVIEARLLKILQFENIEDKVTKEAINYIAKTAHGGMRDAITNLDKCLSMNIKIDDKEASKILSFFNYQDYIYILENIDNPNEVLKCIDNMYKEGIDLRLFVNSFITFLIDCLKSSFLPIQNTDIPAAYYSNIEDLAIKDNYKYFQSILEGLIDLKSAIVYETYSKPYIEAFFMNIWSSYGRTKE